MEALIGALEAALAEDDLFARDPDKFKTDAARLETAKTELAALEEEWLHLEMLREEIEALQ